MRDTALAMLRLRHWVR